MGGWWIYWHAWSSYFREVCDLELPGDLWDRSEACGLTIENAGWWWPHRRFVMVCDRPTEIHREQVGPRGWGSHRLHNEHGPAISWRDGWALYLVHGVRVPEEIIKHPETLTAKSVMAYDNAEVRRIAIERYGWDRFVVDAKLKLMDEQPDPANAPYTIALYKASRTLLGFEGRVLLCTNASPERDGTRRRFGLTCPVTCETALEAAAWSFDVTPEQYAALERAS